MHGAVLSSSTIATARTEPPVKACACGLQFSVDAWRALRLVGIQEIPADAHGPEERLELRDCPCGSTIAVELP